MRYTFSKPTKPRVLNSDIGGVSYMLLILSITFIVITIYGVVYILLAFFSLGDWKDISIGH